MSEAERSERATRSKAAIARLARSRPYRDAAAATHAAPLRALAPAYAREGASSPGESDALSTVRAQVLDAAGDIVSAKGGQALAEQIEAFVAANVGTR